MPEDSECFICLSPSEHACKDCSLPYCSDVHFQSHKSGDDCLPFRAKYSPQVGRYIVATRDIEPLEVVLKDCAAVFGPNHDTKPVCLECLKPLSENDCVDCSKGCGFPLCNNPDCMNGPNHETECEIFRNVKTDFRMKVKFYRLDSQGKELNLAPEYGCIAPLRLVANKYKNKKLWSLLESLMDHDEERRKEEKYWKMFQVNVVDFLRKTCGLEGIYTEEELFHCVGILRTNAFHLENGSPLAIGRAVFPIFSLLSHSCICNCRYSASGQTQKITVRAQRAIKSGEELTIQYISFMYGHLKRRSDIKKCWFFDCSCPRCKSPSEFDSYMSAVKCKTCPEGYITQRDPLDYESEWVCGTCTEGVPFKTIQGIHDKYEEELFNTYENDISRYEALIPQFLQELHPRHYLVLTAKKYLADLYGTSKGYLLPDLSEDQLNTKLQYYKEFKETIEKVDPGLTKWKGNVLFKMYKVLFFKINRDSSLQQDKPKFLSRLRDMEKILGECIDCLVEEDEATAQERNSAIRAQKQLKEILFFSEYI